MNYIAFLKEQLGDYFDKITEETNFDADGNILVYKKLTGTNYYSSQVLPIQLEVYTTDINKFMPILLLFAQENSSVTITQGLKYAKQSFNTPQVLNQWQPTADNYVSTIILNGTLIISDNISDVKEVYIDNNFVEFTTADLTYAAAGETTRKYGDDFSKTTLRSGLNTLLLSAIGKNNALNQKVKAIRNKQIPINTSFNIKLVFIENNEVENYDMKLNGAVFSTSNENMPLIMLTFTE